MTQLRLGNLRKATVTYGNLDFLLGSPGKSTAIKTYQHLSKPKTRIVAQMVDTDLTQSRKAAERANAEEESPRLIAIHSYLVVRSLSLLTSAATSVVRLLR